MLELAITVAAGFVGYLLARNFVRRRLRFVDGVHSPYAPFITGAVAALFVSPAVILPFITLTTAIVFGIGTGIGTASGSRAIRQGEARRRLTP